MIKLYLLTIYVRIYKNIVKNTLASPQYADRVNDIKSLTALLRVLVCAAAARQGTVARPTTRAALSDGTLFINHLTLLLNKFVKKHVIELRSDVAALLVRVHAL